MSARVLRALVSVLALLRIEEVISVKFYWWGISRLNYNSSCECGVLPDSVATRIVGGTVARPHSFPWIVAIFHKDRLYCAGTLINDRYVLSAGHCVDPSEVDYRDLWLVLGMHDKNNLREDTIEKPSIDSITLHSKFATNYYGDKNDICLFRLKKPVRFNEFIRPVCLPRAANMDYSNIKGIVAGWGHVSENQGMSRYLRQVTLRVLPQHECRKTSIGVYIKSTMMCTYSAGKDACQGDSGGPLFNKENALKMEQIGIVSWGIGCAKAGVPGVHTRLTSYLSWIHSHTSDAVYCARK